MDVCGEDWITEPDRVGLMTISVQGLLLGGVGVTVSLESSTHRLPQVGLEILGGSIWI